PLHSTFQAGKSSPLQRWYPFLEGYSPQFVEQILKRFAPQARKILDPFAGVGTTPLTAAKLGYTAFYSEVNPLLQFLTDAKIRALVLSPRDRARVVAALEKLALELPDSILGLTPDAGLLACYKESFGSSQFFSPKTHDHVLRARTLLDCLAWNDPVVAQLATVAVLASLIPCSNLRRAGDLRFRRGEELREIGPFIETFRSQLRVVAEDVAEAEQIRVAPVHICGDSKRLGGLESLAVDTVITSPPYLNGTNYFRNTKLELWFLRCIKTNDDLASFRRLAVTAGINDVTRHKADSKNREVMNLVQELGPKAYDSRIPQMISSYFYDMELCLKGIAHHLAPGSVLALDIGDSVYAGVHVPTDYLTAEIAKPFGFELVESVPLRIRVSRDTTRLRQVLLVFRYNPIASQTKMPMSSATLPEEWISFKRSLPHQSSPYVKRNWGHPLHSLCSYQGKMKPSLAHFLTKIFAPPGTRVLDPFAGVGTIPFEAALQGAKTYAFEISPAAYAIAASKLGRPSGKEVEVVLSKLADAIESGERAEPELRSARKVHFNGGIEEYFHPHTFNEILLARRFFLLNRPKSPSEFMILASLLHILHGNRPYALSRRSHPITPFSPTGPREYRSLLVRLRSKVERSLQASLPAEFVEGRVFERDATLWWPDEVDQLDAIITSPPFFDSTRFYLANWMRLWFAGWEKADFDGRPRSFVDEKQKASFQVYEPVFRQARERLRKGGVVVLHLGQSVKCDMSKRMEDVARPWFRVADRLSENVAHCESHGIRDKGTVTAHQFLVLE
ncbi:MAG: hypothetical protein WA175_06980, partial [Candidatus Acidiferrales bacterium]